MAQNKKKVKQKQTSAAPKLAAGANTNRWLGLAVFIALGVVLFYPPYVRGMFFKEDIFIYHILTALVFIFIWFEKIRRRDYSLVRTPLDWAVLAYALAYLLSLIGAVHPGEALYGFLKALNLFMIYWMVTQVVKDYRGYEKILQILLASGVGVAAIGILAATGYSKYPAAFDGHAIASTLQYSNSTAAFLAVMTLIGLTLWVREEKIGRKLVYGLACFFMLLTVLGALSKGAWLILLAGIVLLVIGMPGVYRFRSVYYLGVAAGAAALTASRFIPAVTGKEPASGLGFLVIGIIVVIVGQALGEALTFAYKRNRLLTAGAVLVLLLAVAYLQPVSPDKTAGVTPELVGRELKGITDLQGTSYQSRGDFARWGMAIVKDHPVVGTGAGGWNALYHQYQDYLMYTTEVHNHFLQVWVEAGTLGFAAFIAMWIILLLSAFWLYRNYRSKSRSAPDTQALTRNWVLNWGVVSSALAFGMHAAIDFDLSLMSLAIILWVLLALINAAWTMEFGVGSGQLKPAVNISLAAVFALVLLYCGSSFSLAFNNWQAAGDIMKQMSESNKVTEQNILLAKAEKQYARAVSYDSWNGRYHADLAQVYAIRSQQFRDADRQISQTYYQKAVKEIQEAGRVSYYDIRVRNSTFDSCNRLGNIELIVDQAEGMVASSPLDINSYVTLAKVLWVGSEAYLNAADYEAAAKLVHKLADLEDEIQQRLKRINPDRLPYWQGARLELNAELQLNIGRAYYLLGDYDKARSILEPLANQPENIIWFAAALYKTGDTTADHQLTAGLEQSNPDLYKRYQQLLAIPVLK